MERERGTALVEFALLLPLVALVGLGTVDLGRAYRLANEVRNAAREAAAYAQLHPTRLAGSDCTTPDTAQWHARDEAGADGSALMVDFSTPIGLYQSSDISCGPLGVAATTGQDITVTVSRPFQILTPLVGAVTGSLTVRSSVTVRVQ